MKLNFSILRLAAIYIIIISAAPKAYTQVSVAREWNEILLEAIRNDYARPTVHARNLYHHSIITYDAWAAFDNSKDTYFLGDTLDNYICDFQALNIPINIEEARKEAISYASFYFIKSRYQNSPDYNATYILMYEYMLAHGYNITNSNLDYINGGPAELGNYLAQEILNYGYTDGSNELLGYENTFYTTSNPSLVMSEPGNPNLIDPNRWQALTLDSTIDQSGNLVDNTLPFLSPEWGNVSPFAMPTSMSNGLFRDGDWYRVYFDTVKPAYLNESDSSSWDSFYKWNHSLVSIWQSHLDPSDGVIWDISPASIGNNSWYPTDSTEYSSFYNLTDGGDPSTGRTINPITGSPYTPQLVPRGDYARVLAEFWADGLDSETPPGHWFEIYHYVSDQPLFERKWQGIGTELDALEFDLKVHLTLGGTMHDAAISSWSLKGYYDYIRPVSSIRYLAGNGQSSDPLLPNYSNVGIPLLPNYIELIDSLDPLAGINFENVNKIKLYTWKGHEFINDPETDVSGAGWIIGENWWPYQRPTFVTPPFSGFVSGHSTFSRAAAGILENITGSPYFPGGMGEFVAEENEFLQFEEGPSVPITLQWATYRDAADQCSLSRIWGGIHPPIDDIPGRMIGNEIGEICFAKADSIFSISNPSMIAAIISDTIINSYDIGSTVYLNCFFNTPMDTSNLPVVLLAPSNLNDILTLNQILWIDSLHMQVEITVGNDIMEQFSSIIRIVNLINGEGVNLGNTILENHLIIDTKLPEILTFSISDSLVNDSHVSTGCEVTILLSEPCNTNTIPTFNFSGTDYLNASLTSISTGSNWFSETNYLAQISLSDFEEEADSIDVSIQNLTDIHGNPLYNPLQTNVIEIDTKNPFISNLSISDTIVNITDLLTNPQINTTIEFNENMNTDFLPELKFYQGLNLHPSIVMNSFESMWIDSNTLNAEIWILNDNNNLIDLDLICVLAEDHNGNKITDSIASSVLYSDLKRPTVSISGPSEAIIYDGSVGGANYFVDVLFDEPMDVNIKPLVVHNASENLNNSLQYNLGASYFVDSMNFKAFFQVNDENIEVDSIDLNISYGLDFAQNFQEEFTDTVFVSLDTKNPSIINLSSNTSALNETEDFLHIIIEFDEEMDTTQYIPFNFTPQIMPPVVLEQNVYSWQSTQELNVTYQLVSSDLNSQNHNLSIEEGFDQAGNLLIPHEQLDFILIDGVVQINQLQHTEIELFPNLINTGGIIRLRNIPLSANSLTASVFNPEGKVCEPIVFERIGKQMVSPPLYLESGLYFIKVNHSSFRLVVI